MEKTYIAESKMANAGRGVFAARAIREGEMVEVCPVIDLVPGDLENINETNLVTYLFYHGKELGAAFIALGFGSIYNHSYQPNAEYEIFEALKKMEFRALKNINKDEEILVNYKRNSTDKTPLWFE